MIRNVILIITSSLDYTVDYLISKYKDVNFFRVNVDMFENYQFLVTGDAWSIRLKQKSVKSEEVLSIYYRKPVLPNLAEIEAPLRRMVEQDILGLLNGIADSFGGVVLTKPSLLRLIENKTYQLIVLSRLGVSFPTSHIGNTKDMDQKIETAEKIIKPLSLGKIDFGNEFEVFQTNRLSEPVGNISLTPVYIQEEIEREYEIRITCIGEKMWPVRIDSDTLDWRRLSAKNQYKSVLLPKDIEQLCAIIMKTFDITFGTFDFIVTPAGEWVFLEVNPNGQWLWLEQALDLDISENLIAALHTEARNENSR